MKSIVYNGVTLGSIKKVSHLALNVYLLMAQARDTLALFYTPISVETVY